MLLWYLRRAVPWTVLLGFLGLAGVLVLTAHRWETLVGLILPVVALLVAAAAAFVLDEPVVAVAAVTPRGHRWGPAGRLSVALLTLGIGVLLVTSAPGDGDRRDWVLVVGGLGATVLVLALQATRRQVPRPGTTIASAIVLAGLTPLVVGVFLDIGAPYPLPGLSRGAEVFWAALAALGALGIAMLLSDPRIVNRLRRARVLPPAT